MQTNIFKLILLFSIYIYIYGFNETKLISPPKASVFLCNSAFQVDQNRRKEQAPEYLVLQPKSSFRRVSIDREFHPHKTSVGPTVAHNLILQPLCG